MGRAMVARLGLGLLLLALLLPTQKMLRIPNLIDLKNM
ncbi:CD24 isoform 7 [Pan troglodytes]|uniref:CD24 molecule n=3 Tax=Homininae TaxID=207598 RepID=A0A087WU21_HUMAN|nr:CD24 isoform 7 [Pan troglodytes]